MGHEVQLIIGREPAMSRLLAAWPEAHAIQLVGEWGAAPLSDELFEAMGRRYPDGRRDAAFDCAPNGLIDALEAATAQGGALAYVETSYFGGTGSQSAGVWIDGRMQPANTARGIGAINSALHALGVLDEVGKDAFDTLRLGERRKMEDYERAPLQPAALPPRPTPAAAPRADRLEENVSTWMIGIAIVAALALGVWFALV